MREGTTSRVMEAIRPYDEFNDFYSVTPEYFGYLHYTPLWAFMASSRRNFTLNWIIG
jgi:hypothetical protein